ncbi:hypothetical protein CCACVL1_05481 [Corchorus capsularis]|uniref:Uncharacterized protein n=1 Tax=Corchorus capsularis TaxID=210143 RepID=A0A1R3JK76_COCAP|nr:hypothetical protein CCACVL1_05481 [Corchorus capsularis]
MEKNTSNRCQCDGQQQASNTFSSRLRRIFGVDGTTTKVAAFD